MYKKEGLNIIESEICFIDGIHKMIDKNKMCKSARKLREVYEKKSDAPLYQTEFGFFSLEQWKIDGKLDGKDHNGWEYDEYLRGLFGYDDPGNLVLKGLGSCEAAFSPVFEEKVLEDRGEHEVVQDCAGRNVLYFKGRRNGFMPEYIGFPVNDIATWEENCKWRLDPHTPERYVNLDKEMKIAQDQAKKGCMISQRLVGGYMYLRSLIGPINLLYKFFDEPELIHGCMKSWFDLADAVTAKHQRYVTIDELFFEEDITYNKGSFISPDMIREFLFPYYQQLINSVKSRQLDKNRHLYVQIDTDGNPVSIIPVYKEIGMDVMSPFEVASGCNVVEIGKQFPELIMTGGIDKRILAQHTVDIDRHLNIILPEMKKRGGYIPTCDHGVPAEVSFENYLHYRKRCLEYAD